jgi:hypothetical protein
MRGAVLRIGDAPHAIPCAFLLVPERLDRVELRGAGGYLPWSMEPWKV